MAQTNKWILIATCLTSMLAACGASPKKHSNSIRRDALNSEQAQQHQTVLSEGNALWEKRDDQQQLKQALAKWEQAVQIKDDDFETYAKLSRGYYFLADGHLSFGTNRLVFLNAHLRGVEHAERGMAAASPDFEKRVLAGTKLENAVKVLGRNALPLIYWYAANLGKWGKAKGFTTVLKHKDEVFEMIKHVHEVGPDFFYGAADRYFGAFYSVAPAFAGGDMLKSYEHFEASKKLAPGYLGTYVLIADYYAPKMQNPEIFDQHIQFVLDSPDDAIPGLEPEARAEKRKAKALLAKKDELF